LGVPLQPQREAATAARSATESWLIVPGWRPRSRSGRGHCRVDVLAVDCAGDLDQSRSSGIRELRNELSLGELFLSQWNNPLRLFAVAVTSAIRPHAETICART
jgi:hypothetical protein